jgi:hypothetical protein
MKKQDYFLLFILGACIGSLMLFLRPYTGYMDADYYYAAARELAAGHGFVQNFLWNYLDNPAALPHPSFTYWMPLSSLISTAGLWVFQKDNLLFARLPFVLVFSFVPVLTARIGYQISSSRFDGWLAGLISLFCGFYLRYITEPDSFSILMILGTAIILLLIMERNRWKTWLIPFIIGIFSGLIHLTRADGLLWLVAAGMGVCISALYIHTGSRGKPKVDSIHIRNGIIQIILLCLGYAAITFPWYLRNLVLFHSFFPPGNFRTALLTEYDQMFSYPASMITFTNWLNQGSDRIMANIFSALGTNIVTAVVIQGNIVMLPFAIIGMVKRRDKIDVKVTVIVWISIFLAMSIIFPFAGKRGGYLHSVVAIQPVLWAYSVLGLRVAIYKISQWRKWNEKSAFKFISILFLCVAIGISGYVVIGDRINQNKSQFANLWNDYAKVDAYIQNLGEKGQYSVMVNDPPAFQIVTSQKAYIVPYGTLDTLVLAADDFRIDYLVLDRNHILNYDDLYQNPGNINGLIYLGNIMDYRIFKFGK